MAMTITLDKIYDSLQAQLAALNKQHTEGMRKESMARTYVVLTSSDDLAKKVTMTVEIIRVKPDWAFDGPPLGAFLQAGEVPPDPTYTPQIKLSEDNEGIRKRVSEFFDKQPNTNPLYKLFCQEPPKVFQSCTFEVAKK